MEWQYLCTVIKKLKSLNVMDHSSIIGNIAAFLTTFSFLPQALTIIKTKDTQGISLPMYLMFFVGVILWLYYGLLENQLPLIIGNCITLVLSGIILFYKIADTLKSRGNHLIKS
jgi:MtN3 and saliva related transmembrane protein